MKKRDVLFAIAILVVAIGWGCGGNGIEGTQNADLRIDNTEIELTNTGPNDRAVVQGSLVLENIGQGEMEVQSVEWVTRPDRLEPYFDGPITEADADIECDSDADCSDGGICLTQSNSCRDRGFRDIPDTVRPDGTFSQSLVLTASEESVVCPEPPDPDSAPAGYCGEIAVETNALNDTDTGANGNARVYIISDGASGVFALPSTFMEFTLASPGVTQTKTFEIANEASTPLEMERINFGTNESWFDVTPAVSGAVIEGNESKTFTLEMTPSEDATEEDLEFDSAVTFDSSSTTSEGSMTVRVTAGIGDAPLIEVDPMQLSFEDSSTQTLRIYNHGRATLPLNSMEIRPPGEVEDYYTVTHDGTDILEPGSTIPNVAAASADEPTYEEFTVAFDAPPEATTTIGVLRINHGDSMADNRTEVTLLGDSAEVAVGEIAPSTVNFRTDGGGEVQKRYLAITNQGNTDLEVTEVQIEEQTPQTDMAEYDIEGLEDLVVPAGGVAQASISYHGETEASQQLRITLESNHAGPPAAMAMLVNGDNVSAPTMEVEIIPSFPVAASVDELANFQVVDDAERANTEHASWLVHQRPSGSQATLDGTGEQVTMIPDEPGSYRISVIVSDGDREVQKMFDFEAE